MPSGKSLEKLDTEVEWGLFGVVSGGRVNCPEHWEVITLTSEGSVFVTDFPQTLLSR